MSILISDFDGTVTRYDFFGRVRKRWPFSAQDNPWEKFVAIAWLNQNALEPLSYRLLRNSKVLQPSSHHIGFDLHRMSATLGR
jgi:hypothetical protein